MKNVTKINFGTDKLRHNRGLDISYKSMRATITRIDPSSFMHSILIYELLERWL